VCRAFLLPAFARAPATGNPRRRPEDFNSRAGCRQPDRFWPVPFFPEPRGPARTFVFVTES